MKKKPTKDKSNIVKVKIQGSDELVSIPLKALKLLTSILSNMAKGKSIALIPTDAEISTQQAAEILNVSRPHVIKLLEKEDIYHIKKLVAIEEFYFKIFWIYESKFTSILK